MSRPKKVNNWAGHTCARCKAEGRSRPKLARMECAAFHGQRQCSAFVCFDHGHKQGGLMVCNACRPQPAEAVIPALRGQQVPLSFFESGGFF